MKPVFQTRFGGAEAPEGDQGNCLQAVLASIFEIPLEDAPDFTSQLNDGAWHETLQRWLAQWNLVMIPGPVGEGYPCGIHILTVKSSSLENPEDGHVVVVEDGDIVHDPNPRSVTTGEREQYWVMACLDPSKQRVADA